MVVAVEIVSNFVYFFSRYCCYYVVYISKVKGESKYEGRYELFYKSSITISAAIGERGELMGKSYFGW